MAEYKFMPYFKLNEAVTLAAKITASYENYVFLLLLYVV